MTTRNGTTWLVSAAAVVALAGAALAACGGGGSGAKVSGTGTSAGATTVVAATTAAPATTSGATTTAAATTTTGASTTVAGPASQAQLESWLLTLADMPTGFSEGVASEDAGGLCEGFAPDDEVPEVNRAVVAFEADPDVGPFIEEVLQSYAPGDASRYMTASAKVTDICGTFEATQDDGTVVSGSIAALSISPLGDETQAYRIAGEISDGQQSVPIGGEIVLVRTGDIVMNLSWTGAAGAAIPTTELEGLATVAYAKLP